MEKRSRVPSHFGLTNVIYFFQKKNTLKIEKFKTDQQHNFKARHCIAIELRVSTCYFMDPHQYLNHNATMKCIALANVALKKYLSSCKIKILWQLANTVKLPNNGRLQDHEKGRVLEVFVVRRFYWTHKKF